jgi:hypothetical protein
MAATAQQKVEGYGALVLLVLIGVVAVWMWRAMSAPPTAAEKDPSTQVACEKFGSVARDIGNGVLNNAEIRDGFKTIYGYAQTSNVPAIREDSQQLLATMTAGGYGAPGMLKAVNGMGKACVAAGY